jgi:hypothetical protein
MTQCLTKAPNRAYKTRSGVGLGMGSHSHLQTLLGPLIRSVPLPDERLGFVRGGGACRVQQAGAVAGCLLQAGGGVPWRGGGRRAVWLRAGCKKAPFPPSPHRSVRGCLTKLFPTFPSDL